MKNEKTAMLISITFVFAFFEITGSISAPSVRTVCARFSSAISLATSCFTFFTTKSIFLGQVVIIINLLSSFFLLKKIFDTSKMWGYVLMIYPTWLTIATTLNTAIWILN